MSFLDTPIFIAKITFITVASNNDFIKILTPMQVWNGEYLSKMTIKSHYCVMELITPVIMVLRTYVHVAYAACQSAVKG